MKAFKSRREREFEMKRPLEGVRILDMTAWLSGPYAMEIVAYLGAEVIKLEKTDGGDAVRANGPYFGPNGIVFEKKDPRELSLCILKRARGRKSITLNLQSEKGKQIFRELVKKFDVVTENFAPGTMDKLGIGYNDLKENQTRHHPVFYLGLWPRWPVPAPSGLHPVVEAMSGVMEVTGYPENPPVKIWEWRPETWFRLFTW